MKYLEKTFSSGANSKEFRDNWDDVFGEEEKEERVSEDFEIKRLPNGDFEVVKKEE